MDYYVCEDLNSEDVMRAMAESDLSNEQVRMLAHWLGLGGYLFELSPMTVEKMIFIHSNVDYNFTAKELNWLTFSSEVARGKTEAGINIFVFKMLCTSEDYYVPSAALIKIFNLAFPENNLFFFKVGSKFAIGCKRTFLSTPPNNFCITALFDSDSLDGIEALVDELSYAKTIVDYPRILLAYSPQEDVLSKPIDQDRFNPDYLVFLDEIQSMYGVNTSSEKEHYVASFFDLPSHHISYRETCEILRDIAEEEGMSSYELLDAAMVAEERALRQIEVVEVESERDSSSAQDNLPRFSEEAYKNAETMLAEALKRMEDNATSE